MFAAPLLFCGCPSFVSPKAPPPPNPPLFPSSIAPGTSGVWRQNASGGLDRQDLVLHTDQRFDPHTEIAFQPADKIAVRAGGCLNTGQGPKLYVDPYGTSSRMYRGSIWIPGATPSLVRFGGLQDRQLSIPDNFPTSGLFLRLGYEKDGTPGPDEAKVCVSQPQPWVQIYVSQTAQADGRVPANLDMKWDGWDPNLLPYYPYWLYKSQNGIQKSCVGSAAVWGNCPDAQKLCNSFVLQQDRISFGANPCTTQNPSIDRPVDSFGAGICGIGGLVSGLSNSLHGHVNWFPATYTGTLEYEQRGPDGDLNIHLSASPPSSASPVDAILTLENVKSTELNGTIELEFNDEETIYRFQSPWWQKFRAYVDADGRAVTQPDGSTVIEDPGALINGATAVVTGLASVDNEHGAHAELHPVYAIAIREYDSPPNTETWAFFARNFGNQGECSNAVHFLDLPDNTYTFLLPWGGADEAPPAKVEAVYGYGFGNSNKTLDIRKETRADGLQISFTLPKAPDAGATLEGELIVTWKSMSAHATRPPALTARLTPHAAIAGAKAPKKATGAEDILNGIYGKLTDDEKKNYRQKVNELYQSTPADKAGRKPYLDRQRIVLMIGAFGTDIKNLDKNEAAFLCKAKLGPIPNQPSLCQGK